MGLVWRRTGWALGRASPAGLCESGLVWRRAGWALGRARPAGLCAPAGLRCLGWARAGSGGGGGWARVRHETSMTLLAWCSLSVTTLLAVDEVRHSNKRRPAWVLRETEHC